MKMYGFEKLAQLVDKGDKLPYKGTYGKRKK
jgi:hypothetical protein